MIPSGSDFDYNWLASYIEKQGLYRPKSKLKYLDPILAVHQNKINH